MSLVIIAVVSQQTDNALTVTAVTVTSIVKEERDVCVLRGKNWRPHHDSLSVGAVH